MDKEDVTRESPELEMLRLNKQSGYNYRERRQDSWTENYTLYRNKPKLNRLTQRQSVSLPMMKQQIRTLLKDVDDMPVLFFENLDNDKDKEIFLNAYWEQTVIDNKMNLQDIIDKRQVMIYGRGFDQWQIVDGKIKMTVQDPQDILVSRFTDPFDIHSSRFLIHTHIFLPLSVLEQNEDYDKEALESLKDFFRSKKGIEKIQDNQEMLTEKNEKLREMGLTDVDEPILGETYVEISLHFVYRAEDGEGNKTDDEQLFLYVEAENQEILMKKPLEEVIGVTKDHFFRDHFPYVSWADDLERQDFWSDSVADIIRAPAKVLNAWFSQLVENRTLRNFGMNYYDTTVEENFSPNTYNPVPWGWYGVPGDPNKIVKKVDIPDLSESLDEMGFLINMTEKATGATPTQQGMQTQEKRTLGEIQLALGEAKARTKGMSKFYTPAWQERGKMFLKLVEAGANKLDAVKLYKEGRNTKSVYSRTVGPKDWMSKAGYKVKVWSMDEKDEKDLTTLQKMQAAKSIFPNNQKFDEIYKRKMLEYAGRKPDEINEIMEQEKGVNAMGLQRGIMDQANPGQAMQVPGQQQIQQ